MQTHALGTRLSRRRSDQVVSTLPVALGLEMSVPRARSQIPANDLFSTVNPRIGLTANQTE